MRITASVVAIVFAFTNLCSGAPAPAAGKDWTKVMELPQGTEVVVELDEGLKY